MSLELHPLCTLFPPMTDEEFKELQSDLAKNGLCQPIVTYDGAILDGGNRYRACLSLDIEPRYQEFDGTEEQACAFVLSANLHRRHLSAGQRAAIVALATNWLNTAKAGDNQYSSPGNLAGPDRRADSSPGKITVADRRAASGASERTQRMADKIAKTSPELVKQVAHGEVSLPKAVEQITGKRPGAKPQAIEPIAAEPEEPEYTELDSAHDQIAALQDALAVRGAPEEEREQTKMLIADLRAEVRRLNIALNAVTASRDSLMRENTQLKRQLKMQRKQLGMVA